MTNNSILNYSRITKVNLNDISKTEYSLDIDDNIVSWSIEINNQILDVVELSSKEGLSLKVDTSCNLGSFNPTLSRISLQNSNLNIYSFLIFLHEYGHYLNSSGRTIFNQIQNKFAFGVNLNKKNKSSYSLDNFNDLLQVINNFDELVPDSNELRTTLVKISQIENQIDTFYQVLYNSSLRSNNQIMLNEIKRLFEKKKILINKLVNFFDQYNLTVLFDIHNIISEVQAWSHAFSLVDKFSEYFEFDLNSNHTFYKSTVPNFDVFATKALESHGINNFLDFNSSFISNINLLTSHFLKTEIKTEFDFSLIERFFEIN